MIPLGATLTRLRVPDRTGELGDVVLGFAALDPYPGAHPHFGSTAGRCANRIAPVASYCFATAERLLPRGAWFRVR